MTTNTLIFLPDWASGALNLKGMNIYINPIDNDKYIVFDTESPFVSPLGTTPWGTVEYDKVVYEETSTPVYSPAPFDSLRTPPQKRLKRQQPPLTYCKKAKMSKRAFATHFLSNLERPSVELLGKIYDVLEDFDINQQTLDVVDALIQSIYTKNLQNTMARVKRSRRFKSQMQYILKKIFRERY